MLRIQFAATIFFSAFMCQPAFAQATPLCSSGASDTDGDGYGWENNASCLVSNSSTPPTFNNLETGNPVELIRAHWISTDFTQDVACSVKLFDGTSYRTESDTLYQFNGSGTNDPFVSTLNINFEPTNLTWGLNNGVYSGPSDLALSPWVEIIDLFRGFNPPGSPPVHTQNATRIWSSDTRYTECRNTAPSQAFKPRGISTQIDSVSTPDAPASGSCDYTSAAQFDGWGWNPVTGTSCEPIDSTAADNCDYSNAERNDGWGWDAVTGQSCAPLASQNDTAVDEACDYENAHLHNGWGWNSLTSTSCAPRT